MSYLLLSVLLLVALPGSSLGGTTKIRCGKDYADANSRCGLDCPSRTDQECAPLGQRCYLVETSCDAPPPPVAPTPVTPLPPLGSTSSKFVIYVDNVDRSGPSAVAYSLGLPSKRKHSYNIINLAFWTTTGGPLDAAEVWANAATHLHGIYTGATTTSAIQQQMIAEYHKHNIKVLVSAFGATDYHPTQTSASVVADKLAAFVQNNFLDGVDLDFEDSDALGVAPQPGIQWLIDVTNRLRSLLPDKIITHAPQAPYFEARYGYPQIHKSVGSQINWYNVQFYNQDSTSYDTYNTLFLQSNGWSSGTAVAQIAALGVPKTKIVVGKGVTRIDVTNTGYVALASLKSFLQQGKTAGYTGGFMGWQFSSDKDNTWGSTLASVFLTSAAIEETGAITGAQAEVGLSTLQIGLIAAAALVATIIVVAVVFYIKNRQLPLTETA